MTPQKSTLDTMRTLLLIRILLTSLIAVSVFSVWCCSRYLPPWLRAWIFLFRVFAFWRFEVTSLSRRPGLTCPPAQSEHGLWPPSFMGTAVGWTSVQGGEDWVLASINLETFKCPHLHLHIYHASYNNLNLWHLLTWICTARYSKCTNTYRHNRAVC